MNNKLIGKLKKKPKWKLREERDDLQMEQKNLREKLKELEENLSALQSDEIAALKANDTTTITLLDHKIEVTGKKIARIKADYKENADVLEVYSKVLKNDREGKASSRNSWFGALSTVTGIGLAAFGLKKAYDSDVEGTLINKKTLDWVKGLPIIRNFGKK